MLIERNNHIIEMYDDVVVKSKKDKSYFFPTDYAKEWFNAYTDYNEKYKFGVKVLEFDNKTIVMEKLECPLLHESVKPTQKTLLHRIHNMNNMINSFLEYSIDNLPEDYILWHDDLHWGNIMIKENGDLVFIDPDSVWLCKSPYMNYHNFSQANNSLFTKYNKFAIESLRQWPARRPL